MRHLQTPPRALPRMAPARLRTREASNLAGEQTTQTPLPYHPQVPNLGEMYACAYTSEFGSTRNRERELAASPRRRLGKYELG